MFPRTTEVVLAINPLELAEIVPTVTLDVALTVPATTLPYIVVVMTLDEAAIDPGEALT